MRVGAACFVVVLLLAAGCMGTVTYPTTQPPTSSHPGSTSKAPPPLTQAPVASTASFSWTPDYPRVGEDTRFEAKPQPSGGVAATSWTWTWDGGATDKGSTAHHKFSGAGDWNATLTIKFQDGTQKSSTRSVFVLNNDDPEPSNPPPPPQEDPGPPVVDPNLLCDGEVVEETAPTAGRDDSLSGLAWAVLKTGFRFAVAWSSESPTTGSVEYRADGGASRTATETVPTNLHLIVVEGLQEGGTICFTVQQGSVHTRLHAARLVNAMNSYEDVTGIYTANYLILVNEAGDLAEVEPGLDGLATRMWDATDGYVRMGANLVIAGDYLHHNIGWPTCYLVSAAGACTDVFDVIVTEEAAPQGAASTYRQGVKDAQAAIWMNTHWQAFPGPISMDDFGSVLTHESGHYLFDMDDLYGDSTVVTTECFDSFTGISIMAGNRAAREFDDAVTPCPNQPAGYTTSWELFRGQFDHVPDRPNGPAPGPDGNGGIYFRATYRTA